MRYVSCRLRYDHANGLHIALTSPAAREVALGTVVTTLRVRFETQSEPLLCHPRSHRNSLLVRLIALLCLLKRAHIDEDGLRRLIAQIQYNR